MTFVLGLIMLCLAGAFAPADKVCAVGAQDSVASRGVTPGSGDVMRFRQFTTRDGLPNAIVRQVAQDSLGFMWLATDYGLYRYDGYELKSFKSDAQRPDLLPSNIIVALACDREDNIWIGTQEGLCRMSLRTGKVRRYRLGDAGRQRVNSLCVTRKGEVYAGTIRGMARYDGKRDTMVLLTDANTTGDGTGRNNVQAILEDASGDLLVGTWDKGLFCYSPESGHFSRDIPVVRGKHIFCIAQSPGGEVWIGTGRGVLCARRMAGGRMVLTGQSADTESRVTALGYDPARKSLLVGMRGGLSLLSSGGVMSRRIVRAFVRSVYRDRHGKWWLASLGGGLFLSDAGGGQTFECDDRETSTVCADYSGAVWTSNGHGISYCGVSSYMDKQPLRLILSPRTGHVFVATNDDGFWVGTGGRLLRHYVSNNCGFVGQGKVLSVTEDSKGNWWVVTNRGLGVRYADGREYCFADIAGADAMLKGEIVDIEEDYDGTLWLTTQSRGVMHLSGDMSRPERMACDVYDVANGRMPVNIPLCLYLSADSTLWLGTEGGGLCQLDREGGRFETVHGQWHLPGDMVTCVEQDDYGCLWIGTNHGLARLTVRGGLAGRLRVYTTADGLPDNFFEQNASCRRGGRMYFGTASGLVSFVPEPLTGGTASNEAAITGIAVDGQALDPLSSDGREYTGGMTAAYARRLVVPASARSFTVGFASLAYSARHQCMYAYRLVGFDTEWNNTTADRRTATYTNLSPGKYMFELKATDGNGNWSEVRTLEVVVEPPFWCTWWAYIIYICLAVAAVFVTVRRVRGRMMTRNRLQMHVADDGQARVVVAHDSGSGTAADGERSQLSFDIVNLNYTDADEDFLRRAVGCVNSHLGDADFSIPDMAGELGTSRSTLFKRLKTLTGMNVSAFISDIRLKAACKVLDEPGKHVRVSELAYMVGFNDPKYFSLCFRKKFGLSPTEYMERKSGGGKEDRPE